MIHFIDKAGNISIELLMPGIKPRTRKVICGVISHSILLDYAYREISVADGHILHEFLKSPLSYENTYKLNIDSLGLVFSTVRHNQDGVSFNVGLEIGGESYLVHYSDSKGMDMLLKAKLFNAKFLL